MVQIELRATTRDILGKKVRFLRREGIIPVHLIGPGIESLSLQCDAEELRSVVAQAGKSNLIKLKLDKEKKSRNVLVREIQRDVLEGSLLHVDLYQARMADKVKVEIPITLIGEAPALKSKSCILTRGLNNLTVECLLDDIPPSIEIDLGTLTEAEQAIHVSDIKLDEKVAVLDDPDKIVAKINTLLAVKDDAVAEEKAPAAASSTEEQSTEE